MEKTHYGLALLTIGVLGVLGMVHTGQPAEEPRYERTDAFLEANGLAAEEVPVMEISSLTEDSLDLTTERIRLTQVQAENGSVQARIEVLSPISSDAFGEALLDDRRKEITSIYMDKPAPYAAVPGVDVTCLDRLRPDVDPVESGTATVVSFYSNEDLVHGACTNATAVHRADVLLRYCPGTSAFYTIELHGPTADVPSAAESTAAEQALKAVRCSTSR